MCWEKLFPITWFWRLRRLAPYLTTCTLRTYLSVYGHAKRLDGLLGSLQDYHKVSMLELIFVTFLRDTLTTSSWLALLHIPSTEGSADWILCGSTREPLCTAVPSHIGLLCKTALLTLQSLFRKRPFPCYRKQQTCTFEVASSFRIFAEEMCLVILQYTCF